MNFCLFLSGKKHAEEPIYIKGKYRLLHKTEWIQIAFEENFCS